MPKTKLPDGAIAKLAKPRTFELFRVHVESTGELYYVAAPEFMLGMQFVFNKHGAQTTDDLPKGLTYTRVEPDVVHLAESAPRKRPEPKIKLDRNWRAKLEKKRRA